MDCDTALHNLLQQPLTAILLCYLGANPPNPNPKHSRTGSPGTDVAGLWTQRCPHCVEDEPICTGSRDGPSQCHCCALGWIRSHSCLCPAATAAASASRSTEQEREQGQGWLQRVPGSLSSTAVLRDNSSSKADVGSGAVTHGLK